MLKRQNQQDKFTTFIDTEKSYSIYNLIWIKDLRLERSYTSIIVSLETNDENYEKVIVNHLVKRAQGEGLSSTAYGHLTAYLEDAITWAVKTQYKEFCNKYTCTNHPMYSWQDCVCQARCVTAAQNLQKILDGFDPEKSSLKTFVAQKISDDMFRFLRMGIERAKYSHASLLRTKYTSKRRLRDSIQKLNIDKKIDDVYALELAQSCFNDIYVPVKPDSKTRRLEWPERDKLTEIAKLYEQKYRQYIKSSNYTISVEELDELLNTCVKALRQDIKREIFSHIHVNNNYINEEGEEVNFIENLADDDSDPGDRILEQELNEQMRSLAIDYYRQLPQHTQNILLVKLGLSISSQTEIGDVLSINQSTVSRELLKAKEAILNKVVKRVKANSLELGSLNSHDLTLEDIENISIMVNDCLKPYLTSHFVGMLNTYLFFLPKLSIFYKYLIAMSMKSNRK
jgi:hypothetical protein